MNPLKLGTIAIRRDLVSHPLIGQAHVIEHDGHACTAVSAIDWDHPQQIPVVAEPGRLPPGAGGRILNHLALAAARAGIPALRYAGPYPTPALYRSLARSFHASAGEDEFTADLMARAARLARDEIPVDFVPAPHTRVELACGHVEVRDGVQRAVLEGTAYEPGGSPARLVPCESGWAAELWFGDAPWARTAELAATGELVAGPHAPPRVDDPVVGQAFPRELCAALAELVAEAVPAPLAADARARVAAAALVWADLGTRAARATGDGFAVHAALWQRVAPLGLARLALALAEALGPVVTLSLVSEIYGRTPLA